MLWVAAAALVLVGLAGVFFLFQRAQWAAQCKAGAAKIHAELTRMYAGEHRYTMASPAEFTHIDPAGYREVAAALTSAGFRHLGAFEDLTVTAVYPHNRTYVDAYASADGAVGAGTYLVGGKQVTDLITALEDGRALITTNAFLDKLIAPPFVRKEILPVATTAAALVARHRSRLDALRSADAALRIVPSATLDEVMAYARRHSRLTSEHRQALGLLTEAELMSMVAEGQEATGKRVWREFLKLTQSRPAL